MTDLSKMTELRKLLMDMERSLGLQELSPSERDIFYAATDLSDRGANIRTTGLMEHALVTDISRPTFFRALKSLVDKGYLAHSNGKLRGHYTVNR